MANGNAKTQIYYDGASADGFLAAYAAWKAYGDQAEYHEVLFGEPPPAIGKRDAVFLGIPLPEEQIKRLAKDAASLLIIDHHASATPGYEKYPALVEHDPQHSTCVLTWRRLHPSSALPRFYEYVEDAALGLWRLPQSREVDAAVQSHAWTWTTAEMMLHSLGKLMEDGAVILRVEDLNAEATLRRVGALGRVAGFEVPIANATAFVTMTHARMLERTPGREFPFTATFMVLPNACFQWDLRAAGDFDVGALAKFLGGGGGPRAALVLAPADDPFLAKSAEAAVQQFGGGGASGEKGVEG